MRKSLFLSIFLLLFCFLPAWAQTCLVVELRDGNVYSYQLDQKPTVTFHDSQIHIESAAVETDVPMADVLNFHFADAESDMRSVAANEMRITYVGGRVTVTGFEGRVALYDLNGRCLQSAESKAGGSVGFDLGSESGSVFLLRAGRQCVKLMNNIQE